MKPNLNSLSIAYNHDYSAGFVRVLLAGEEHVHPFASFREHPQFGPQAAGVASNILREPSKAPEMICVGFDQLRENLSESNWHKRGEDAT